MNLITWKSYLKEFKNYIYIYKGFINIKTYKLDVKKSILYDLSTWQIIVTAFGLKMLGSAPGVKTTTIMNKLIIEDTS